MCVAISFLMTFVYVYTMEPIQCNLLWNWVNCAVAISSPQSSLCRPGWHLAIALLLVDVWQSTCQDAIKYCNQKSPCWLWSNGIKLFTYFNHTGWQAIDWIVVDVVTRLCNLSLSWDMFELHIGGGQSCRAGIVLLPVDVSLQLPTSENGMKHCNQKSPCLQWPWL